MTQTTHRHLLLEVVPFNRPSLSLKRLNSPLKLNAERWQAFLNLLFELSFAVKPDSELCDVTTYQLHLCVWYNNKWASA